MEVNVLQGKKNDNVDDDDFEMKVIRPLLNKLINNCSNQHVN